LGIRFSSISESLSRALEVPRGAAQIAGIEEGGAAAAAGLKEGDVIVALNGKDLSNSNELLAVVGTSSPGDRLEIEYVRGDQRQTTTVELGERPEDLTSMRDAESQPSRGPKGLDAVSEELGLTMESLDSEEASKYGLGEGLKGVLLTDVDQTSEAYRDADIRPRDVIVEADRQDVENLADFVAIYERVEAGQTFLVRVNRRGSTFLTALTKPE